MGSVVFKDVTKIFNPGAKDEVYAVKNSHLTVEDGEFMVFVGPSGCGKSTSLRLIAGLERATSGRIFIGDRDVTNLHPRARSIAMVFQDYALYPHMTVKENLSFGLKNLKYERAEIEKRVKEASEILGLGNLLERVPRKLSGGQRQRVALGRAIVRNPEVFLLDEPLSNLDAKLRVQMRVELAQLQRRLGTTMVYVTHDQEEAMTLGHRIVVMDEGLIMQVDSPESLYNKPQNVFVAQFIGSPAMNMTVGRVQVENDVISIVSEDQVCLRLPAGSSNHLKEYNGKQIYLGIRPEDFNFEGPTTDDCIEVPIKITVVEMLGPQRLLYFYLGQNLWVASVEAEFDIAPQTELKAVWPLHKTHFFDGETKERIHG